MKIIQALMILVLVLLFFNLAPLIIWILKLVLALGFFSLAYERFQAERFGAATVYLILGLMFLPFIHLGLGLIIWRIIQVVVLLWLIMLIFGKEEDIF